MKFNVFYPTFTNVFLFLSLHVTTRKLEPWGYVCCSEDRMIVAGVILTQCPLPACVRQTDGRTDLLYASTALCIASYADAL